MIDERMQRAVRKAITLSDELSRGEHLRQIETGSEALAALRTRLQEVDRGLGGAGLEDQQLTELSRCVEKLSRIRRGISAPARLRAMALVWTTRGIARDLRTPASGPKRRSHPLVGVLPLGRIVSQDVHSLIDYAVGIVAVTAPFFGRRTTRSRVVGASLAGAILGVSAVSDYRLSVKKLVPIEAHEIVDYAFGAVAITSPFLFNYWRRSPVAAAAHVACGALVVLKSLLTDYRATRGIVMPALRRGRGMRFRLDPRPRGVEQAPFRPTL